MLATSHDAALEIAVRRIGHRAVLEIGGIDLAATTFIDVVGVHAVLDIQALATQYGCRVAVIAPPGPIRRVFDLTGTAARLALFADRSEAHRLA
jgi:anti-anti-sigma regulatory factor